MVVRRYIHVYRFPYTTYPYSSCICSFLHQHSYILFVHLKNIFRSLIFTATATARVTSLLHSTCNSYVLYAYLYCVYALVGGELVFVIPIYVQFTSLCQTNRTLSIPIYVQFTSLCQTNRTLSCTDPLSLQLKRSNRLQN